MFFFKKKVAKVVKTTTANTQDQLQSLRLQVEELLNHRVTPVIVDAAGKAEFAVQNARSLTTTQVENVSTQVRDQPIIAIAIAAIVGYLVGRILH